MELRADLLPVLVGPLCGDERPYHPSGWMIEVTEYAAHRYIFANDDTGAKYWSYTGTVPLASRQQS